MSALEINRSNSSQKSRRVALIDRLNNLEKEMDKIRQELAAEEHIQSSYIDSRINVIHKCPDEVLLHIFSYYLENNPSSYGSQHPHIRRLLLICKRWYPIVMNARNLWARIEIKDAYDLLDYPNHKSLVPYIKACIERSNGLPLDIELNLLILPDVNDHIAHVIYNCNTRILGGATSFDLSSTIKEIYLDRCYDYFHKQLSNALDLFLDDGLNSAILTRYRTLNLTLPPDRDERRGILESLQKPFPQLISLKLDQSLHDEYNADFDLPVAESLEFNGLSLNTFKVTPSHLRHLSMENYTYFTIKDLLPLQLLQTLKLSFHFLWPKETNPPVTLHFPHLHTLSLFGDYYPPRGVDFYLPSLDLLTIHCDKIESRLPKLSPRRIMWYFDKWHSESVCEDDIMALVKDFVLLSSRTEHITVPGSAGERVMAVLADCGQARADSTPNHVTVDFTDGRFITIDIVDQEKLAKIMEIPPHLIDDD